MPEKVKCCYCFEEEPEQKRQCINDAEWEVNYGPAPDNFTLACSAHVGELLSEDYNNAVFKFNQKESI